MLNKYLSLNIFLDNKYLGRDISKNIKKILENSNIKFLRCIIVIYLKNFFILFMF
jgi:hypothetical protein